MKKTGFFRRILNGFGILILMDFCCLMISMLAANYFDSLIVKLLTTLICLVFVGISYLTYAYRYGEQDRKLEKRGQPRDRHMALKIGIANAVIPVVLLFVLFLSKMGVIGNFQPVYQLANSFFMATVQIFSGGVQAVQLSFGVFPTILVLIGVIPAAVWFGYDFGYRDIDLIQKIFYAKKS